MKKRSIAKRSLALTGLFEAELLTELLLRYWEHPNADDAEFRDDLLEAASGALRASVDGQILIQDVPPDQMNLVAALWYAEWSDVSANENLENSSRIEWLEKVKRAIPSCFCDSGDLS